MLAKPQAGRTGKRQEAPQTSTDFWTVFLLHLLPILDQGGQCKEGHIEFTFNYMFKTQCLK